MSEIVTPLLQWLNDHPHLAGLFTFVISAAESVAIIGTIVPGSIMMAAIGALAGTGVIPLWPTIIWAILGAIVGDGISYWIGYYFKDRLHRVWPFRTHPTTLKAGEKFFYKYGSMSVFIGRFVGPVRALVPLVAGMFGMKPWKFLVANVASAIGWAPAYMLPGIILGAAARELPPDIAMHVILVFFLILLFILLCLWFVFKLLQLIHNQINQLQNSIWLRLQSSRFFSPMTVLLKHHDRNQEHGQFTLALLCLITILLFTSLVIFVKYKTPLNIVSNDIMFHLFRGLSIRGDRLNSIMINLTLLGQKEVLVPVAIVLAGWLMLEKRPRAAIHTLALVFLTGISVFVLKHIIQSPRPWGILRNPETFSMPSGHATMTTVCYLGVGFLIAYGISPAKRWVIYSLSIFIILLVGLSRLYLGVHWFTDILSGWLLGATLLSLVIISFQRKYEPPSNPLMIFAITAASLFFAVFIYHHFFFEKIKQNTTQVPWPAKAIKLNQWWQKNQELYAYRTSLFGYPSQLINIQWVGDIYDIRDTLMQHGWVKPPARDFSSTLHRLADISSIEYLPLISPQYLDKRPALILTRLVNNKTMLVIRLWHSHRYIQKDQTPLWVGFVGIIPRSYSWLSKKHPVDVFIDPIVVFPKKNMPHTFEFKIMTITLPIGKKQRFHQRILLIRPKSSSKHK